MKSQYIVPGMIFSLVDRRPVMNAAPGQLPMHLYLVVSSGSEACLQDIQCMSISSMRNKDITYELPIVVNDSVSYVIPYNIVSFRRDDVKMEYYRGFLINDLKTLSRDEFLQLCRDTYTDALYGDIDKSVKDRISAYQKSFTSAYKDVPRYEGRNASFGNAVIESSRSVIMPDEEDKPKLTEAVFKTMVQRIDSLPHSYSQWADNDIFNTLIFFAENDLMGIVSQSNRYKSTTAIKSARTLLRKRVENMDRPIFTVVINGHEYHINFRTGFALNRELAFPGDVNELAKLRTTINKSMQSL